MTERQNPFARNQTDDLGTRLPKPDAAVCPVIRSRHHGRWMGVAVLALFVVALPPGNTAAQECRRAGTLTAPLEVFDRPPTFSTAQGTTQGTRIAVLGRDSTIYLCRQITVGFGVATSTWSQISYYTPSGWKFGWALAENIKLGARRETIRIVVAFGSVAEAAAESLPTPVVAPAPPENALPPPPPAPPGSVTPAGKFSVEVQLWTYLLIALVLGIFGQTVIDIMGRSGEVSQREIWRRALTALIYAPIVFLALLQTTELDIATNKQLLVIVLLAFQSGFFWQKVFERSKAATGPMGSPSS